MNRRRWAAAIGGVVLVGIVGAGVVMAQTPTPGSGGTGTTFLDRVAQKLGIETPKLQQAVKSAANDQIDAEVQAGKLTPDQANALKQKVANSNGEGIFGGPFGGGHGERRSGFGPSFGIRPGVAPGALATFLGTTPQQLMTELQASGATLATVAQAHGKSRADLETFITQQAKTDLDSAVANGKMTQQQADAALSKLTSNLDSLLDGKFPGPSSHGMWPNGRGPKMPQSSGTPGAGTLFGGAGGGSGVVYR